MKPLKICLTDEEFEVLFGAEIAGLIRTLSALSKQKCLECRGKCCQEVGCKLYSDKFTSCPIYEIRPSVCRYHFCQQVLNEAPLSKQQKGLLQRPVKEFFHGDREQLGKMFPLFPAFPLSSDGLAALGIKEDVESVMKSFEEGKLTEELARSLLQSICRRF